MDAIRRHVREDTRCSILSYPCEIRVVTEVPERLFLDVHREQTITPYFTKSPSPIWIYG